MFSDSNFPVTHLPESWEARFSACLNWGSANEKTQEDYLAAAAPVFLSNREVEPLPSESLQNCLFQRWSVPSPLSDTTINVKGCSDSRPNTRKRLRSMRARGTPEGPRSVCAHALVACAGACKCLCVRMCMRMCMCMCSCFSFVFITSWTKWRLA